MKGPRYRADGILARQAARRVLRPYAKLLGTVVWDSWQTWSALGTNQPAVRAKIGSSARAFNLADFIKYEMVDRFKRVGGCELTMPYDRPVLTLAEGDLRLKFGKINIEPTVKPQTERQLAIYYQDEAVAARLPGMPSVTWAKCGYLLDPTETQLTSAVVTCELDGQRLWQVQLPLPASQTMTPVTLLASSPVPPARISSAHTPASADTEAASSD